MKPPSSRQLLITYVPPVLVLAAVAAVSLTRHVSVWTMTADPAATANFHPLTGAVSNLGVLLWCSAASICAFAAAALRPDERESRRFLLSTAALSSYMLFDDLFMFHEYLAPRHLGMEEKAVYAILGLTACAYYLAFRRLILRTNAFFLLAAGGFLACSAGIDALLEAWLSRIGHWEYFIEDGAKWLGIASWCSYCASASFQLLAGVPRNEAPPAVVPPRARSLARL